jgi:acyl-CoA thioesterase I
VARLTPRPLWRSGRAIRLVKASHAVRLTRPNLRPCFAAKGLSVRVVNAGINGDTTGGMLARLDRVVPKGTNVVILQPGGNDRRKLAADNTPAIQSRLAAMGIKVVMLPNGMLHGLPHQPDGQHLTPEGYHMLAEELVAEVAAALGN